MPSIASRRSPRLRRSSSWAWAWRRSASSATRWPSSSVRGRVVDHAQRAERIPVAGDERRAGVEPDARILPHERVVAEPRVIHRIGDDEQARLFDRVRAERHGPRRLADGQADARLEPLAVFVHQGDQGNRRAADLRRQQRQIVERLLGIRVQDAVPPQGSQAAGFVGDHGSSIRAAPGRRPAPADPDRPPAPTSSPSS